MEKKSSTKSFISQYYCKIFLSFMNQFLKEQRGYYIQAFSKNLVGFFGLNELWIGQKAKKLHFAKC